MVNKVDFGPVRRGLLRANIDRGTVDGLEAMFLAVQNVATTTEGQTTDLTAVTAAAAAAQASADAALDRAEASALFERPLDFTGLQPTGAPPPSTPGGTSGEVQWNNAGSFDGFTLSGDATLDTSTGIITVTSVGGVVPTDTNTTYTADESTLHLSGTTFSIKAGGVGPTELASTAVSAGSYTNASITVDADGRLTAASTGPLVVGFILGTGATGSNVGPWLVAPRAGSVTKCKVVTKASDASTDLTFTINRNGVAIFSSAPTVAHGTSAGTISTFTGLTSSPLTVAADDLFTIDITSGTSSWQATVQLE